MAEVDAIEPSLIPCGWDIYVNGKCYGTVVHNARSRGKQFWAASAPDVEARADSLDQAVKGFLALPAVKRSIATDATFRAQIAEAARG